MSEAKREEPEGPAVDTVVRPTIEAAASRMGDGAREELEALGDVLAALAACDLATAAGKGEGRAELASAASRASVELAERLSRVRASLARARSVSGALASAASELASGAAEGVAATDAAVAALRQAGPRTEEVAEVVDHLEEVASQAGVAALNVSVEVSRAEGSGDMSVAFLAEEVRRLADRAAAVARRLTAAVEGLRSAWSDAATDLESSREGQQGAVDRAEGASALARDLDVALAESTRMLRAVRLPEDARASEAARRLRDVEDHLDAALSGLSTSGEELSLEVAEALSRLEGRLRALRGD